MNKYIIRTTSYRVEDEKLKKFSVKLAEKFDDSLIEPDMVDDLISNITTWLANYTGWSSITSRLEMANFRRYKISCQKDDKKEPILEIEMYMVKNYISFKEDVKKLLAQIYVV